MMLMVSVDREARCGCVVLCASDRDQSSSTFPDPLFCQQQCF